MTDRIRTIHVILDQDYRVDDGEAILNAIRMIKGVAQADFGPVMRGDDHLQREIAKIELRRQLLDLLHPEPRK